MTVEHRDARELNDIELVDHGHGPAFHVRHEAEPDDARSEAPADAGQRILQAIENAEGPLSQRQIRERAATRPATVAETLHKLTGEGRVERVPEGGYRVAVNDNGRRQALPTTVTAPNPGKGG